MSTANNDQFRQDVLKGLSAKPKYLQSKYFYDAEGDKLFQQIMASPEYYLTRCEAEIFQQQHEAIAKVVSQHFNDFDIVELGAGDATKSIHLLRHFVDLGFNFNYIPVDISANVIADLERRLPNEVPGLQVQGLNMEYSQALAASHQLSDRKKLVLFLGSNIGNFSPEAAAGFLKTLHDALVPGDLLFIGFDLKKNPKQILAAYNDEKGITRQFNLNLLQRINRELDGNIITENFDHYPSYDPMSGACRSYLVSLANQDVMISGHSFHFEKNEAVYMELSQKYSVEEIDRFAAESGFVPVAYFYDHQYWFLDAIWERL